MRSLTSCMVSWHGIISWHVCCVIRSAVRSLLKLPPETPLLDEFRCHSETFAAEKRKGEGRLYITPSTFGLSEGRGRGRMSSVCANPRETLPPCGLTHGRAVCSHSLASVETLAKNGAGVSAKLDDGLELTLIGFVPRARDKAFALLSQLVEAAQLQAKAVGQAGGCEGPAAESADRQPERQMDGEDESGVLLQGWLSMVKRGAMGFSSTSKTERRWCQLSGALFLYAEKMGGRQSGFFHVGGATVSSTEKQASDKTFSVELPARTYVLQAESQESLERWLSALQAAAAESVQIEQSVLRQSFSFGGGGGKEKKEKKPSASPLKALKMSGRGGGVAAEPGEQLEVVTGKKATVRKNASRTSAKVGTLPAGTIVDVLEHKTVDGQQRVRIGGKVKGWTSLMARDGKPLLAAVVADAAAGGDAK